MDEKKQDPALYTFPEDELSEILEQYKDEPDPLLEEYKKDVEFFSRAYCPICGGRITKTINPEKPFVQGRLVEAAMGVCESCGYKLQR